jgi:CcmD family protein
MTDSNLAFIIAAYSVAWVAMLGYVARLVRKGSSVRSDFDRIVRDQSGVRGQ